MTKLPKSQEMKKRLYYHPKKKAYLVLTIADFMVIQETEGRMRRALKENYRMPSKDGYKFIGDLK